MILSKFKNRMIKLQQRTRVFISFIDIKASSSKIEFQKKINMIIWESINHFESFIDRFRYELDNLDLKSFLLESNTLQHNDGINSTNKLSSFEENSQILKESNKSSSKSEESIMRKIVQNLGGNISIRNSLRKSIVSKIMQANKNRFYSLNVDEYKITI